MGFKFRNVATLSIVTLNFLFTLTEQDMSVNSDISSNNGYRESVTESSQDDIEENYIEDQQYPQNEQSYVSNMSESKSKETKGKNEKAPVDCWMSLSSPGFFKAMDELDKQYEQVRLNYQQNVGETMDKQMLEELLSSRGAAHRAVHRFRGDPDQIPAGINLGGYSMMRLRTSVLYEWYLLGCASACPLVKRKSWDQLKVEIKNKKGKRDKELRFFHRMKLRNSTNFQINYLHNDLVNMAFIGRIGLNDIHLLGAYERSATHKDPSILYYRPSYGTIEVLLKNVGYKMEARLRMLSDRITIELIKSELVINNDVLMTYLNTNITEEPDYTVKIEPRNIDDFLQRLKTDLDLWMKDYFNDYLMYYQLPEYDHTQFQEYEKKKTIYLNEYVNYAVNELRQKVYNLGGAAVRLPKFTMFSVPNMVLKIKDGVLRGLDTMHRRSVATGMKKLDNLRVVDVIIGFSRLKVEYKFEAVLPNGLPPLTGILVMSANEMTAHMGITLVKEPDALDLNFDFIRHMKPESLTVEGPANRLIANFKHHLENHIIAMMSNALIHNIKMLNTLTRCVPFLYGYLDEDLRHIKQRPANVKNETTLNKKNKDARRFKKYKQNYPHKKRHT